MAVCYVIGAAPECVDFSLRPGDAVIAADGGLAHLQARGLRPDWVVGDFDSLGSTPTGDHVLVYPAEKDDTDTMLALKLGWEKGFRLFYLLAATGGRMDHTVANLQALSWLAARGGRGVLADPQACLTVIGPGRLSFPARESGTVSVFAWGGPAHGVTLTGLRYTLDHATLYADFPLGVSNHFIGCEATVQVESGQLLVYWQGKAEDAAQMGPA